VSRKDPGKDVRLEPSLAGRDVESGDLACAAVRVSNVLLSDPALPDAHETLARLADHPRDGRDLFPMTSPLALARVVARAHVVAAAGDSGVRATPTWQSTGVCSGNRVCSRAVGHRRGHRVLGQSSGRDQPQAVRPGCAGPGRRPAAGRQRTSTPPSKLSIRWALDEGVLAAPRGIPGARFTSIPGGLTGSSPGICPGRPASAAVALVGVAFFAILLPWTTGLSPWSAWMQAARCSGRTSAFFFLRPVNSSYALNYLIIGAECSFCDAQRWRSGYCQRVRLRWSERALAPLAGFAR